MRSGLRIVDCDRHVMEPGDIWEKYLDKDFQHHGVALDWYGFISTIRSHRQVPPAPFGDQIPSMGSVVLPSTPEHRGTDRRPDWRGIYKRALVRKFDNVSYLADMDREGVDQAVLFTSMGLYATYRDDIDPELSAAMCRAYNDWLYDYCSIDPNRLKGVVLLPFQDVDEACAEAKRAAERGMVGVFWRPNPVLGRRVSDGAYDPLFETCESLGLVMCSHEGQQETLPYFTRGRVSNIFARHCTSHPFEQMGAFLALLTDGVLDRFPALRVAFLESGAGWLPYWLERLEALYGNPLFADEYRGKERPSEYFRRLQCYISCESDEEMLKLFSRLVGEDCLMWASDYPHPDEMHDFPNAVQGLIDDDTVSPEFIRKILFDNPVRFYGLNVTETAGV